LDAVLAADAKNKAAYNAKGLALEAQGKYREALAAYEKALQVDPKWKAPLVNKMHAQGALGKNGQAMEIFVKV
jgi:tetratricopeptide (TPR) repeat protein